MSSLITLLQDMNKLESELRRFEIDFGVRSQEFYTAMMRGDLEEFDELDQYRMKFLEWFALYKTWLSFDKKYQQLITRQPIAIQIKSHLAPVYA